MEFHLLQAREPLPMELLLEVDPFENLVRAYCDSGCCMIGKRKGEIIGVYVLLTLSDTTVEIKNVAVAESFRGQDYGQQLVQHALAESARHGFEFVEISVGNSSLGQLALYQKCGFRMRAIDPKFFRRNYPEPIFENGIECRDMIRLRYTSKQLTADPEYCWQ
ncbi:GNAT family N-acetyltransferase [Planococcus sp. ISL-110]|uniref:GNAT family N-acetyltransferase n=1 Tax=Planococcus sp. ISL-110 TaxID=2819167 RepID=UPI001BE59B46|nr:GNAT family N-acetyltransferase [Planococcus sp. ISL-110]MBT2570592.1 GNAT family N-acetyltransferase [Planococcus sp. ISL-110]